LPDDATAAVAGTGLEDKPGKSSAYVALGVICFAIFVAALDQTAVSALLVTIIEEFEPTYSPTNTGPLEMAGWIITAYLIGYTVFMPIMGRVADLLGHRFLFNISMVIFIAGSVLCALSPNFWWLAVARAIQAIGGGAIIPIAMGIVGFSFSRLQQGFAIGLLVAAGEAGGVLGPLYGAYLAEPFGWRFIFWVNIPLGIAVIAIVRWLVAKHPRQKVPIDYRGAALLALFLTLITVGLSGQKTGGWLQFVVPMLVAGAVVLAAFIFVEKRAEHPALRLSMFRNVTFSAANIANLLEGVAMITALVQIPFFAYATVAATPIEGGLLVVRMTVFIPLGAIAGGLLINRISHRYTAAAGFTIAAIGLFLVSRWGADVSSMTQTRDLMLVGLGFGLNSPALAAAVVGSIEKARLATGSAIHIVAKTTGMMLGLAILGGYGIFQFESILDVGIRDILDPELSSTLYDRSVDAILQVLNRYFLIASILWAIAIIPALMLRVRGDPKR
jgi:EmrB/QacA subfamily drug resistance transporter